MAHTWVAEGLGGIGNGVPSCSPYYWNYNNLLQNIAGCQTQSYLSTLQGCLGQAGVIPVVPRDEVEFAIRETQEAVGKVREVFKRDFGNGYGL